MLLVVDVGNTNITLGLYRGENLEATFRLTTKRIRTSDEYGLLLCDLLEHRNFAVSEVKAAIIASVVPDLMYSFLNAFVKYFQIEPLVVNADMETGIRVDGGNPREIGADRLVDLAAGYEKYGAPSIVVDYGTATTYDLVAPGGIFLAGVTAPGIRTSLRALWGETAMLPAIEIKKPSSILAKETVSSMCAGLVYGTIGETEYIIKKMKEESGYHNAKVIATGGLGKIIAPQTSVIEVYDPMLTLEGLRLLYEKNRGIA